jgi:hypothetical protein
VSREEQREKEIIVKYTWNINKPSLRESRNLEQLNHPSFEDVFLNRG